jgi:hypothetical protein
MKSRRPMYYLRLAVTVGAYLLALALTILGLFACVPVWVFAV